MTDREHEQLRLAVDMVILTVRDGLLHALTIERDNPPFRGQSALPGGFLRAREDLLAAATRELREETGIDGSTVHLEQLATYGDPDRDPRSRVVSVAYLAIAPNLPTPIAGSDAQGARWAPVEDIRGKLAFDHDRILADALERACTRLEYSTLATAFCREPFTIGELRTVYEVVWGEQLDPRNFSRKVLNTDSFVEATGDKRASDIGRPAALYRRGTATALNPPILRSARD